jgi:hypothetical protein
MDASALSTTRVPNCWTAGESRSARKPRAVLVATTTAMAASMPAVVGVGLLVREGRSALSLRGACGSGGGTAVVLRQATREKVVVLRYAFADMSMLSWCRKWEVESRGVCVKKAGRLRDSEW